MKKILYALRFITVIPLPYKQEEDMTDVARSLAYFPLIGALLGLLLWGTAELAGLLFSTLTAGFCLMAASIILTGGLHLDGLSDLADGLGGGMTREKRLEIMKDSRIGAFGALTLIGFLILKGLFYGELLAAAGDGSVAVLILVPLWARFFGVIAILSFPTARPGGLGDFFRKSARPIDGVFAGLQTLLITGAIIRLTPLPWLLLPALTALIPMMMIPAAVFKRMLGGLTGDCYGALMELAEALGIVLILIVLTGAP